MNVEAQLRIEVSAINQVFSAFGVEAVTRPSLTVVAGHSFVAYGLRLATTQRIGDVHGLLPELSERLSAVRSAPTLVRLRTMPLALEVAHPMPKPLDWRGAILRIGPDRLLAGRNYSAMPPRDCIINLHEKPHALIAGTTGSGKSTILRMMLTSAAYNMPPEKLRMVLVDLKNSTLPPFSGLPHVERFAYMPEDARSAIDAVYAELQRRIRIGGVRSFPRLLLVIDELAQLDNQTLAVLSNILSLGREININVVAATQHPTVKLIGSKANYPVRLVGQVVDANTAEIATGRRQSGAWQLPGAGAFLHVDGNTLDRLQAYNLDATTVPELVGVVGTKWGKNSTQVLPPPVDPISPVESDIERIAKLIEPLWLSGASKTSMTKTALDRPYAGSYAAKIDRALAWLEERTSTTTTTTLVSRQPATS